MAAYGKGQMLGSGINPESFKLDFGGFADAARMQAQGIAGLGQSIGGAIQNFGEAKKEQKKVDAYNKASAKSIEAAITLGKSYGITAAEETLAPFLKSYNDPNLSPIEKAALLDEGKAMIPNVFGRFDKNQAMLIEKAAMEARNTTGERNVNLQQGEIVETINGKQYKVPVVFDPATGTRTRPDGTVVGTSATASGIASAASLPTPQATGGLQGKSNAIANALELPTDNLYTNDTSLLPPLNTGVESQVPTLLPFEGSQPNASVPSYAIPVEADEKQGQVMSPEEVSKLIQQGYKISGTPAENGQIFVTDIQSLAPQKGEEIIFNSDGTVTKRDIALGGKAEALAKAERASEFEETRQTNFIIDKANEAEEIINYSISTYGPGTLVDMAKSTIPGTQEYKLKNQILPAIKDSIALSSLKQLKAASPTGASGLGSLTEKEGKRLENMYGVLDVGGDKVTLKNDIKRLKQTAFDYIHGSKKEREEALANGDITKDENDQVEKMYREQILGVTTPAAPTATPYTGLDDKTKKALEVLGIKIDE
jgi:hypothetical protein